MSGSGQFDRGGQALDSGLERWEVIKQAEEQLIEFALEVQAEYGIPWQAMVRNPERMPFPLLYQLSSDFIVGQAIEISQNYLVNHAAARLFIMEGLQASAGNCGTFMDFLSAAHVISVGASEGDVNYTGIVVTQYRGEPLSEPDRIRVRPGVMNSMALERMPKVHRDVHQALDPLKTEGELLAALADCIIHFMGSWMQLDYYPFEACNYSLIMNIVNSILALRGMNQMSHGDFDLEANKIIRTDWRQHIASTQEFVSAFKMYYADHQYSL